MKNTKQQATAAQPEPYDVTGSIIDYEAGQLEENEIVELFQHLVDTGMAWTLQGSYGCTARALMERGLVKRTRGKVTKEQLREMFFATADAAVIYTYDGLNAIYDYLDMTDSELLRDTHNNSNAVAAISQMFTEYETPQQAIADNACETLQQLEETHIVIRVTPSRTIVAERRMA